MNCHFWLSIFLCFKILVTSILKVSYLCPCECPPKLKLVKGLTGKSVAVLCKGWPMVNARLCKTARPAFFSARPRLFVVFGLRDGDSDPTLALQKNSRLQDVQNRTKNETSRPVKFDQNFVRTFFFRDHSPPLLYTHPSQVLASLIF